MANMKIISMLDAKVSEAQQTAREDLALAINIIEDEINKIGEEMQQVRQRVSKLEEGVPPKLNG
jgi:predicted  nucleic acid-binding Zn-ribbon protein